MRAPLHQKHYRTPHEVRKFTLQTQIEIHCALRPLMGYLPQNNMVNQGHTAASGKMTAAMCLSCLPGQ